MSIPIMIEVTSSEIKNRSGVSKRTGKDYSIDEQTGWMHLKGVPYPEKIRITLAEGQSPYAPGKYVLHSDSFFVDRFGAMSVRPVLVPPQQENK